MYDGLRTVSRFAQKTCRKKIYRGERVFFKKNRRFFLKKHARPKKKSFTVDF